MTSMQNAHCSTAESTALRSASDQELRVPCYCEENVWRLAYRRMHKKESIDKQYYVAFVSNPSKCVCYFYQRAAEDPTRAVFWDYHVILLEEDSAGSGETLVLDIDSYLPYPCTLTEYLQQAFPELSDPRNAKHLQDLMKMAPIFRLVDSAVFLRYFSSDRRHMWDSARQKWKESPPMYACIQGEYITNDEESASFSKHNLMSYIDMQENKNHEKFGTVYTLPQLRRRFGCG